MWPVDYRLAELLKEEFAVEPSEARITEMRKNVPKKYERSCKRLEDLVDRVRKGESSPVEAWRPLGIALEKVQRQPVPFS